MMTPSFPFSAIAGQNNFKLALILSAINPAIGGVVVSGPRGCAKSTLVRGLADLLPNGLSTGSSDFESAEKHHQTFITLPLGASEEMLLGTLDLQKVLDQQEVKFRPGLLSRAHGGVLYVDEVNLLADHLVDQLLDVAASGINRIERDGISHNHPAEFLLIGTMNPDEGELRPQLQDRFGLCVQLENVYSPAERVEIVRSREAFDRDPEGFCQQYAGQQNQLKQQIQQARQLLPDIQCDDVLRYKIAKACCEAQVDGMRADIVWYRAALAHAALQERTQVTVEDIDAVAELVLAHRRKAGSGQSNSDPDNSGGRSSSDNGHSEDSNKGSGHRGSDNSDNHSKGNTPSQSGFKRPENSRRPAQHPTDKNSDQSTAGDSTAGNSEADWGSMAPQKQTMARIDFALPDHSKTTKKHKPNQAQSTSSPLLEFAGKTKGRGGLGVYRPHTAPSDTNKQGGSINWFSSLLSNRGQWPMKKLSFQPKRQSQPVLHLVLLDTSASTLTQAGGIQTGSTQQGLLAQAKAVVLQIAQQAYLKRQQLAIIGFGNHQVELLFQKKKAPKDLQHWLEQLPAGGGTPLRQALEQAQSYLKQLLQRQPELLSKSYLLTDGRSTCSLSGLSLPGDAILIDTEQGTVKRGRGAELAQQLGAQYLPFEHLLIRS